MEYFKVWNTVKIELLLDSPASVHQCESEMKESSAKTKLNVNVQEEVKDLIEAQAVRVVEMAAFQPWKQSVPAYRDNVSAVWSVSSESEWIVYTVGEARVSSVNINCWFHP